MVLDYLYFENYKCFSKPENTQIRPLTILIGRNSSGKSVIARLPILISHSIEHTGVTPLDLHFDGLDYGSSTVDLIYDRVPHGSLTIGAGITGIRGDVQSFKAKIQHFDEYKLQLVTQFEFKGKEHDVTLSWRGEDPNVDSTSYFVSSMEDTARVEFRGLFPRFLMHPSDGSNERDRRLNDLRRLFQFARNDFDHSIGRINYLGPFRKEPERTYRFPTGVTRNVGFSGAKVSDLLGEDSICRNGKVLEAVNRWVEAKLGGWQLAIARQGDFFSIVLRKPGAPSVEINIADVGTGISQVLPIIVQRMFDTEAGRSSGIEIVEQPELHLHPAVHGDVAELYVLAAKIPSSRLIVETHSENFILRVRQLVARGELNPEDVIIYWVDDAQLGSTITTIHIDAMGEVDNWPTGVFSEDFLEVREIRRAQKPRKMRVTIHTSVLNDLASWNHLDEIIHYFDELRHAWQIDDYDEIEQSAWVQTDIHGRAGQRSSRPCARAIPQPFTLWGIASIRNPSKLLFTPPAHPVAADGGLLLPAAAFQGSRRKRLQRRRLLALHNCRFQADILARHLYSWVAGPRADGWIW